MKHTSYPHTVEELPDDEFFAILYPDSVTIPGDERSRTNPGHGYPQHTVDHWRMEVYATKESWEAEIIRLEKQTGYNKQKFKAIRAIPAKIITEVRVEIQS